MNIICYPLLAFDNANPLLLLTAHMLIFWRV